MKPGHRSVAAAVILTLGILWTAAPVLAGGGQTSFAGAFEKFKNFYQDILKKNGIVGSSFMFVKDNTILAKDFYGMANLEKKIRVSEDTIYHWASITKTFTGIAIMQLRDRGLLKLDDPVVKYLPELRQVHNPFGDMEKITLRHLMSHSAGFRGMTWPWKSKPWHPHEPLHWSQLVAMFPYTEVLFEPGSRWAYSNLAIIFLGRIIELLTTDDWEIYIDKNIFKPLGMTRSYFDTTPYFLMPFKCQSYWVQEGELVPADPDVNTGITVSNGGLKAPFGDFVKYLNFLMGTPGKEKEYAVVLSRSSLEEMFTEQIAIEEAGASSENSRVAMGLTFFLEDYNGMHFVAHSGGQNAFVTHFYLNTADRTGYIVGFNTVVSEEERNTRMADSAIRDYLMENIFPLFRTEK